MPHIAVTMLPGRDRETKQKLAENLCNTLIETSESMPNSYLYPSKMWR